MYRGLRCAVGPASPPPTPTPARGAHCPPVKFGGRLAASAFGASACGAAVSSLRRGFAASVSRPIDRVLCRVYTSPLILLSECSARCP